MESNNKKIIILNVSMKNIVEISSELNKLAYKNGYKIQDYIHKLNKIKLKIKSNIDVEKNYFLYIYYTYEIEEIVNNNNVEYICIKIL